jgi:hypothetical protein
MKDPENFLKCCIMNSCQEPGCDNYEGEERFDSKDHRWAGEVKSEQALYDEVIISKCNNCQCKPVLRAGTGHQKA